MNIQQRTPEWYAARTGRVTGSAVGAILGLSPWQKQRDVLRRMVRDYHGESPEFISNPATEYGTFHESGAIAELEMEHGIKTVDCGFFVHPEHDWLGASPDGLIGDDALLEVKCPFGLRNGGEFKSIFEQLHYYAQIQIELYCTGRTLCYFWQWCPFGTKLETVEFNQQWIDENLPRLKAFHELYLSELKNKDHLKPLRKQVDDDGLQVLIDEYDALAVDAKRIKARQDEIMEALKDAAGHETADINGRKLTCSVSKSVKYAEAIKSLAAGADLSEWTTESVRWRFT